MTQKVYFPHIFSQGFISGDTPAKRQHQSGQWKTWDPENREEWREVLGRQPCSSLEKQLVTKGVPQNRKQN